MNDIVIPFKMLLLILTGAIACGVLVQMPYGFYVFIRSCFFIAFLYVLVRSIKDASMKKEIRFVSFALIILYNPIVPVHLRSKTLWTIFNLISVALLFKWNHDFEKHVLDVRKGNKSK